MSSTDHPTTRNRLLVPVIVAVTLALVTAVLLVMPGQGKGEASPAGSTGGRSQSTDPSTDPSANLARREEGDPMAIGKVDAPVVMVNYSEFQCPFCGKFARDTEPELIRKYVDTGILRIEWRDFPYLGEESLVAAHAGRAAAAQGKFWEFHEEMFRDQQPPNSGRLDNEHLTEVAKKAGLDVTRFAVDMDSTATATAVQKEFDEGQQVGVTGTPAFLVNGRPIIGAQPTAEFVKVIEEAEKAARS